jgi:predicted peptidase
VTGCMALNLLNFSMRPLSLLAGCVSLALSLMTSAQAAETQTIHHLERTITKTVGYKYLLALPTGYDKRSEKQWPLMLFLHGSGERGDDVWSVARHGPPKLLRGEPTGDAATLLAQNFIVVSPQCPKHQWWDRDSLLALLDEVITTHNVDRSRVYLTGLSMGGYAAWELGVAFPERFAALVPVCGGGNLGTVFSSLQTRRDPLRNLPVWAFHGAKDETVPLVESERMIEFLKRAKASDVQLTVYPNAKHDSWTETYANPELYRWLLQRRPANAPEAQK